MATRLASVGNTNRKMRDIPVGSAFGRLVTISSPFIIKDDGAARVKAICECGNRTVVRTAELLRQPPRGTRSCGCLIQEAWTRNLASGNMGRKPKGYDSPARFYNEVVRVVGTMRMATM